MSSRTSQQQQPQQHNDAVVTKSISTASPKKRCTLSFASILGFIIIMGTVPGWYLSSQLSCISSSSSNTAKEEEASIPRFVLPPPPKTTLRSSLAQQGHRTTIRSHPKNALVCITGQLSRLALVNKMKHVIRPLQEAGYHVSMALVLSDGKARFSNRFQNGTNPAALRLFDNATQVLDMIQTLSKPDHSITMLTNAKQSTYMSLAYPNVPSIYYMQLKEKSQKTYRTFQQEHERTQNHYRIFDAYQRCGDVASLGAASSTSSLFDLAIRIRDDIALARPLNVSMVEFEFNKTTAATTASEPTIIFSDCRTWDGMNDRFAIVSKTAISTYFSAPLDLMKNPFQTFAVTKTNRQVLTKDGQFDWSKIKNPETMLYQSYKAQNIRLVASPQLRGVNRMIPVLRPTGKIGVRMHPGDSYAACPTNATSSSGGIDTNKPRAKTQAGARPMPKLKPTAKTGTGARPTPKTQAGARPMPKLKPTPKGAPSI